VSSVPPSAVSMSADGDVRACEYDLEKLEMEILLTNTTSDSLHN